MDTRPFVLFLKATAAHDVGSVGPWGRLGVRIGLTDQMQLVISLD